jgi:hypothetical protein
MRTTEHGKGPANEGEAEKRDDEMRFSQFHLPVKIVSYQGFRAGQVEASVYLKAS